MIRMRPRPELPQWHAPSPSASRAPSREAVQAWLDAYVLAWKSFDEATVADLWTEDAVWHYPFQARATSRAEITAEWMRDAAEYPDQVFDAHYEPIAIDGDLVVAHGRTVFFGEAGDVITAYDNIWVLRFGPDGRCAEFHEWYAGRPEDEPSRAVPD